jgi:hypothetical protein
MYRYNQSFLLQTMCEYVGVNETPLYLFSRRFIFQWHGMREIWSNTSDTPSYYDCFVIWVLYCELGDIELTVQS